ncbi:hypothetical protein ATANTOWER_012508 [Ataeniobius toweri]|uniref:Uncharacterized protein n=1 Tax=Ataeniobius toweri TaxID=208326 RepID=A0ABU7BFU8_9TELE|nr:hypothetical protein [Ataeniobius toweri]
MGKTTDLTVFQIKNHWNGSFYKKCHPHYGGDWLMIRKLLNLTLGVYSERSTVVQYNLLTLGCASCEFLRYSASLLPSFTLFSLKKKLNGQPKLPMLFIIYFSLAEKAVNFSEIYLHF